MAMPSSFVIKGVLFGLAAIGLYNVFINSNPPVKQPVAVVQPAIPFTPEQLAQREEARKAAKIEQEKADKAYRLSYATQSVTELKNIVALLEGAETDLKKGNIGNDMEVYAIGAELEVINSTAKALQAAWDVGKFISAEDMKYIKSIENKLSSFQQKALPKMRRAFVKRTAETLWAQDIVVSTSGSGNSIITMIGYQFAANANINDTQQQLSDLLSKLRFKQIRFASSEYTNKGSLYDLTPPNDSAIAYYANGFQKLDRKSK